LATLSISVLGGSASPALSNAGAALGVRRPAVSVEDPRDQRFARLRHIRHADPPV
jgi:hypothetical protein